MNLVKITEPTAALRATIRLPDCMMKGNWPGGLGAP